MKRLLVFLLALCVLVGLSGSVSAALGDQDVELEVLGTVDFSLTTTLLDYGPLLSGEESAPMTTTVHVGTTNNVELLLEIEVTNAGTGNIFENIYYDLDGDLLYTDKLVLLAPISTTLADPVDDGEQDFLFDSVLRVPAGFGPGMEAGVVTFTATDNTPP